MDNNKFYSCAIKKFGVSAKGVHWLSEERQSLRFDTILHFLPTDLQAYRVADAGCGFGDFYLYLSDKERLPLSYLGIDMHPKMCSITQQRTKQKTLEANICKERLPVQDYYVCSGALNILTEFETHLFIQNCYRASKKAFIFNVLYADKKSENYNYVSKEKIESIAENLQVKQVFYKEGYIENDLTIIFFR